MFPSMLITLSYTVRRYLVSTTFNKLTQGNDQVRLLHLCFLLTACCASVREERGDIGGPLHLLHPAELAPGLHPGGRAESDPCSPAGTSTRQDHN